MIVPELVESSSIGKLAESTYRMIPGTALGVLLGDLVYTWLAFRLARRTNRSDVTAMPLGLDTPSTFGVAFFVLLPALEEGHRLYQDHEQAMIYAWHVGALVKRAGRGGPVLTGVAFALAWTPCTGPTLGAIITATGASSSAAHGALLLAVYCAGLAVPFLVTALAFGTATTAFSVVRRHYPVVIGAGGVVLIGMGVLIWTGEFTQLNITVNHWLQSIGLPDLNSDT